MKKIENSKKIDSKKLNVSLETIRKLDAEELERVVGGYKITCSTKVTI